MFKQNILFLPDDCFKVFSYISPKVKDLFPAMAVTEIDPSHHASDLGNTCFI